MMGRAGRRHKDEGPPGFRPPKQERSRRTLDRIAGATRTLLTERGPAQITVQDVVARARTSVGAFYTRFDSKDDAVAFVRERFWRDLREHWREFLAPEAWSGVRAEAVIAEVIRRFCRMMLADDRPLRAFYLELLQRTDTKAVSRLHWLDGEIAALVGGLLAPRLPEAGARGGGPAAPTEVGVGKPSGEACQREAAAEGFRRVISAVRDHLLFGTAGGRQDGPAASRALILSLTRMYSAYLGREPPASYAALLALSVEARRQRNPGGWPERT